mmetsp:Transcript_22017/g.62546  ORF Transcript_22017/g.62546 Transcript_22017/m.62546 type:complete len:390 (+) Transcript_22017:930-2099(+)
MPNTNMMRIIITNAHMRQTKEFIRAYTIVRRLLSALIERTTRTTRTTLKTRKMRRKEKLLETSGNAKSSMELQTKKQSKRFHLQSSPMKNHFLSAASRNASSMENQEVKTTSGSFHLGSVGRPSKWRMPFFTSRSATKPMKSVFATMAAVQRNLNRALSTTDLMKVPYRFLGSPGSWISSKTPSVNMLKVSKKVCWRQTFVFFGFNESMPSLAAERLSSPMVVRKLPVAMTVAFRLPVMGTSSSRMLSEKVLLRPSGSLMAAAAFLAALAALAAMEAARERLCGFSGRGLRGATHGGACEDRCGTTLAQENVPSGTMPGGSTPSGLSQLPAAASCARDIDLRASSRSRSVSFSELSASFCTSRVSQCAVRPRRQALSCSGTGMAGRRPA